VKTKTYNERRHKEAAMQKHMKIILSIIAIIVVGVAALLTVFKTTN